MITNFCLILALPNVKITPKLQSVAPSSTATVSCHVVGEPQPAVSWLKNDEPLRLLNHDKYTVMGNGTQLSVNNVGYADTGAYMCSAVSQGGESRGISTIIIQDEPSPGKPRLKIDPSSRI